MQGRIEFPKIHHGGENNKESQENYNINYDRFSKQCKVVYSALLRGERLTTVTALLNYGIGDLRRRKKDLIDFWGVPVKSETKKGGYKEIYFDSEFIKTHTKTHTI